MEYTKEEMRDLFLQHVKYLAEDDSISKTTALFSLLVALDGGSMALPGFKLIPAPHPDDKEYHESRGEKWYPEDVDIGGGLHEYFAQMAHKD